MYIMYPVILWKSKPLSFGLFLIFIVHCSSSEFNNCYPLEEPTLLPNTTLDHLTLHGQCYTACIDRYQDIIRPEKFYHLSGEWYSVSFNSFSHNCSYLQKVLECQSGCLLRPFTDSRSECRDSCYEMCSLDCSTSCSYSIDTVCTRQCRKPPCNRGCIEYIDTILANVGGGPSSPNGNYLQPVNTDAPGMVKLSITNTNATNMEVTSFVVKLEQNQHVRYLWLPTLTDSHLNLTQYSCQYINISYAAINKYGLSNFSPTISHYVSGEQRFPRQLNSNAIQFTYTEDLRPMYVGNALVNVSWSHPTGLDYATHFELKLQQIPNPTSHSFIINKTSQFYLLQASSPGSPPAFGKTYAVTFIVHPSAPGDSHTHLIMSPRTDSLTPNMTVTCSSLKSDVLNISLNWEINNDTNVIVTIEEYRIIVSDYISGDTIDQIVIQNQEDDFKFSEILGPYILHERGSQYHYKVELIPMKSSVYFWRNVPLPSSCVIDGTFPDLPPLPIPVSCINVSSDDQEHYVINWCQPSMTYGSLISYQLLIGDTILNVSGNITTQTIKTTQYGDCSLLQIRSNNDFAWSNWSIPLLAIPCITTTSSSTSLLQYTSINDISSSIISMNSDFITTTIDDTPAAPSSLSTTTTTTTTHSLTVISSKSSIWTLFPSVTSTSTTLLTAQPTSSIIHITSTVYFLSAIIGLLLILIPLTIIGLIIICFRYRHAKMLLSVNNLTASLEPKRDTKFVPSAENKLAVENIYTIISTPV